MSINMSEATFGYLLIAVGLIAGAGLIYGMTSNRSEGYKVKLKHLAFPFIAIAVGVGFAFGLTDRSSRACEPRPGESFCLPGASAVKKP